MLNPLASHVSVQLSTVTPVGTGMGMVKERVLLPTTSLRVNQKSVIFFVFVVGKIKDTDVTQPSKVQFPTTGLFAGMGPTFALRFW